ncbi:M23 family metallopeptidase [Candidatus Saccharibacteria bacterium]|nr:M23 family metallopeptidase [Candidatus Saccharibacteria bacterium]
MPTPLLEKPDTDQNDEYNPGERNWDDKTEFDRVHNAKKLQDLEGGASGGDTRSDKDSNNEDPTADVRNKEESPQSDWANKFTGGKQSPQGFRDKFTNIAGKSKLLLKKKGASIALILLLGGGASMPFLGTAILPFAILGNQNVSSMLHGLTQYSDDYWKYRIYGATKGSVGTSGGKIAGLYDPEIEQLKAKGVSFEGEKVNSVTGKKTFTSVRVGDGDWVSASAFKKEMVNNPSFRKAMVFDKGSYFKSSRNSAARKVMEFFNITRNPDIGGATPEEIDKKIQATSVDDTSSNSVAAKTTEVIDENGDSNTAARESAESVIGEMNEEVDELKAAIANGDVSDDVVRHSNMGNTGYLMTKEGVNVSAATKPLSERLFGFVNVLEPVDALCTVYQVGQTANTISRTVALANVVRFSLTVRAALERAQAGDDDGSLNHLMTALSKRDPITGQSFDSTLYAEVLFTGKLSGEPSTVSATGGKAMITLYETMFWLHTFVGGGNAFQGRAILRNTCNVATNLGVQIVATVGAAAASFTTGGAAGVGAKISTVGINKAITIGVREAIQGMVDRLKREYGDNIISAMIAKKRLDVAEQGVLRTMSRDSVGFFKAIDSKLSGWDKLALLAATVGTFGMSYIVNALAGADIAGILQNGPASMDAIGTGMQQYEFANGIASGGTIPTYDEMTAYQQTLQQYQDSYLAGLRYDAKDTPLDANNPYSTLGSMNLDVRKTIGLSAFDSPLSAIGALATLPFRAPSSMIASAVDDKPTPEEITSEVGNSYFIENKIALQAMGSPQVIFPQNYSFEDILEKLVDSSNPQLIYEGDDEETGGIKMRVIPGSDLEAYQNECHNPIRTELDPQFGLDDGSNLYDADKCLTSGKNYDSQKYPLYDDALRYMSMASVYVDETNNLSNAPISGNWTNPMKPGTYYISSYYGPRWGSFHNGIDFASPINTPYFAAADGTVTFVGEKSWGTYYISIDHGGGIITEYGHSYPDQVRVRPGDKVTAGQLIALIGNQGNIVTSFDDPTRTNGYGAHLHFNYIENGTAIDPIPAMASHGVQIE